MSNITPIDAAIFQLDFEWLESTYPLLFDAIAREMSAGKSPADIRQQVYRATTVDRAGLAKRCFNAAAHMAVTADRRNA